MTFEMIKKNYDRNLWNAAMVGKGVEKGVITSEEYQTITGQPYTGATGETISPDEVVNALEGGV